MTFPNAPRVVYKKNPLDKVICQLRFSPILRIDTKVPDEFQERIQDGFPEFREKAEIKLPIFKSAQKDTPAEVQPARDSQLGYRRNVAVAVSQTRDCCISQDISAISPMPKKTSLPKARSLNRKEDLSNLR